MKICFSFAFLDAFLKKYEFNNGNLKLSEDHMISISIYNHYQKSQKGLNHAQNISGVESFEIKQQSVSNR